MKTTIETIARKPLLSALLGERSVSRVDVREITFKPGQKTPRHLHPCPVLGYVAKGAVMLRREGQEATLLQAGSAFYEPADTVIATFDNASETEPTTFIACYLLNDNQHVIELLPDD